MFKKMPRLVDDGGWGVERGRKGGREAKIGEGEKEKEVGR